MKNTEAFENKTSEVCYVPENGEDGYTHQDFLAMAEKTFEENGFEGDPEKLARAIFDQCTWQHPETILDELHREDEFEEYPETYGICNF